jgi:hypothetical protein
VDGKFKEWTPDHQFGPVGNMFFDSDHGHIHFDEFSEYALLDSHLRPLRQTKAAKKVSFCIIDFHQWKAGLEGDPTTGAFGCGAFQGIDVGYEDTYESSIPGQFIDITGVPDGTYYVYDSATTALEETNKKNNAAMVEIEIKGDKVTVEKKIDDVTFTPKLPVLPRDPGDKNPIDDHPTDAPISDATKKAVDAALANNAPVYPTVMDEGTGKPPAPRPPSVTRGLVGAMR